MLRREGPQEWIFNEYAELAKMHFRFKDKEIPRSYVVNIVDDLLVLQLVSSFWNCQSSPSKMIVSGIPHGRGFGSKLLCFRLETRINHRNTHQTNAGKLQVIYLLIYVIT